MTLAACGGAAPEPNAPARASDVEEEPTSVEEAQEQIARLRERLASKPSSDLPVTPGAAAGADTSRPSAAKPAEPAAEAPAKASKSGPADGGRCSSPCRALASMRRAVTALCRMTGETDPRCTDARRTLTDSEGRITPCSC
jgi:hypothetical protein